MDIFGRKRIAKLEKDNFTLHNDIRKYEKAIATLRTQIREMDQDIFNISQKTSYPEMQSIFARLIDKMMVRKKEESDRIGDLVIKELNHP